MARIEGAAWSDWFNFQVSQRERPLPKGFGLWCPDCKHSHPYNGKSRLGFSYEWREAKVVIMWTCPHTGSVLGELS